jgi:hypothetical protein
MVRIDKDTFVLPTLVVINALLIHGCTAVPYDKYQKTEKRNMPVTAYDAKPEINGIGKRVRMPLDAGSL